jgi:uroporphyrinogen decarboxylase
VIAALNHKQPARLPYSMSFTEQAAVQMKAYVSVDDLDGHFGGYISGRGHFSGWADEMPGRPGYFKDAFGVVWNRTGVDRDIGVLDHLVLPDIAERTYMLPRVDESRIRAELSNDNNAKDNFIIFAIGFSMFERAWSFCGFENTLMYMATQPEALEQLLDDICDYNCQMLDIALEYDIDGVYLGDDWGQQNGLIMGPKHWRRFIKPRMKRMYDKIRSAKKYVLQHSCGDCREIMPDLAEIGLDCYQTFQPEIYDCESFKKDWGGRIAVWGGISTQALLAREKPGTVKEETGRIIGIMNQNGGYIAAPTHALTHDIPPENITAMHEVFIKHGRLGSGGA